MKAAARDTKQAFNETTDEAARKINDTTDKVDKAVAEKIRPDEDE